MESKLKKITYLAISLLMALLLNNTLIFNNGVQTELSVPKQSAVHEPIFIDGAATGVGAHNWTWAEKQSWCSGDGSWGNPYIIENLKINGSGTGKGIDIVQSDVSFIIQDCLINNTDTGIYLQDVNNARLINNNCSNLNLGMEIDTCNNNTISGNTANGNTDEGINLYECYNNTISGNTANDNNFGIYLSYCGYNNITGNTANDNGESGIYIEYSSNNILSGNSVTNNGDSGIAIDADSNNHTISGNSANGNIYNGIYLANDSSNNTISGNTANDNGEYGIYLYYDCSNNSISGNTANNNTLHGIYLNDNCDFNNIINNTANNNTDQGIYLETDCDNNNITDNIINDNNLHGIYLDYICDFNNIINNTANDNTGHGIFLSNSVYSNITDNTIDGNVQSGIYLLSFDHSNITGNTINDNTDTGIYLETSDYCNITDNTINGNTGHGIYLYHCEFSNVTDNAINDNTETGIHLYFNSDYNVIKNNTINRNDLGIGLYWSDNNNISGNTLIDNSWCIYENEGSAGNIIEYNDCSPPTVQEPIFINDALTGVGEHNWTWAEEQPWCSGSGTWNDPYIIENLKIKGFEDKNGIEIWNSNVSFIIQDCLIYNSNYGIYLENVNNSRLINNTCSNIDWGIHLEYSNNNTISGNTANGNEYEGIYLTVCMDNTLSENTANDNKDSGIHLDTDCVNNTLSGNTVKNNGYSGISIEEYSDNNTISGNTANNNKYYGIYLYYCDYNTISNNFVNNTGDFGISIHYSEYNTISDNIANYNGDIGIQLYDDNSNNTISNNVVSYNGLYGIGIFDHSENNIFTENILYNNTIGVYIDNADNNSIYENLFLENGKHAGDYGTDNKWNSTSIGNYWDNWTSPDVNPNDGIVDLPYNISGLAGSKDYLPIAEDGAPSITINSPTSSGVFGATAPSFDVTITDIYLDSMWYTIDGGINNYTFIENGIINQTAWTALTEGSVTITFYASDIFSNIGIAEVSVVKDITAPIIVINSPTDGEEFGNNAPLFNITVTENNLDAIWYSFDGGVTTFAITDNTVFNQTAWTALPEGDVTITFYANDTLGHEASEAVTVVKRISAAGLDPGIIITIVVVSIAGGVAVAAVIFIYLKKRASPE